MWLLLALPLLGAALLLIGGKRTDKWGPYFAIAMSCGAFVVGAIMYPQDAGTSGERSTRQSPYLGLGHSRRVPSSTWNAA